MKNLLQKLGSWLDSISYWFLVPTAFLLALAPFTPEPHLVETTGMLLRGELTEGIYIFDFFMHSSLLYLVAIKIYRDLRRRRKDSITTADSPI